ncbi:UNVERIFIED_CONTAM: hypothetical protein GTU68_012056 [Idotea baltica]|nr:hypothetical protein [Idotea baltica]
MVGLMRAGMFSAVRTLEPM